MLDSVSLLLNADELIKMALKEDISNEDVSTNAVLKEYKRGKADLICKQDGVICGLPVFERVFTLLDKNIEIKFFVKEGEKVGKSQHIAEIAGDMRVILQGERTALNYLQRMSGIATYTAQVVNLLSGSKTKLLDTRKTTPNMRIFEKYAVKAGGGNNHRYNLSDGVLLKDNHIGAAGGIKNAVKAAKEYSSFVRKIEVEVETLEGVKEAVEAGADIIMLDNMSVEEMTAAVKYIGGRALTECSGNVTKDNIKNIISTGVDFVSSGALTHSAPILDLSLKNLHPVEEV
ncbi:MAG: carboxylating nicotinate-nucleotide diphosphorylase [Clostridia bacterium]|nr:carboxylating nicotinate-nucleotide diphosphorylase [Clostridia bacterium]